LQRKNLNVTILLAGTGECEEQLLATATKCGRGGLILAGFIPPEELVCYYLAADIYAHCSEVEPHSLAISEAIYVGLPIVISDRCGSYGPSDDVRHGFNGFVYPCGVPQALAAYVAKLAADSNLRERMGRESLVIGKSNQRLAHGRSIEQVGDSLG
jgi:glycosyltransferase involved in cell wall biosynthesis